MKVNSVVNCTHILRTQAEYDGISQAVVLRCILEMPATGERRGFTDIESLLTALRSELMEVHNHTLPLDPEMNSHTP
ncbi:MAG: hypothetical protein KBG20_07160 [Caldilineaceae bacterium]|nr:hypothetical protein [Caldilineaceae bacterium]MBP8109104.1 hypothetical protein [Caldilineaceae bacterium]MBP8122787.1 hypothetical protein [Caldilineaceae bacterium]MBP9072058.1 hypothetical protein [Caldilineaceae bacterium]